MFDYLRNLTKSDQEKQQEALNAYLDDALTSQEKKRFEQRLAQNPDLQAQVTQLRSLKQQMRSLPQRRVPRNFMLDPQKYGRPQSAPLIQAYPILRTATVFTAFFFVIALAANVFLSGFGGEIATESVSAPIAMDSAVEESEAAELPAEETFNEESAAFAVEVTRVVTEEFVEEEVAMEEAAKAPSEAGAIDTLQEGAPAADEMPLDATRMIAGTAEFKETDLTAPDDLKLPASEDATLGLDSNGVIPQIAATLSPEYSSSDEAAMQADDAVSNRDMPAETIDQARPIADPWLITMVLLGILFFILLLLTWSVRRRL